MTRWRNAGKDYCGPVSMHDYRKGDFHWPETRAGSQRIVRCPYANDDPSYASYDCLLSVDDETAHWTNLRYSTCHDPPFTRAVDSLHNSIVSWRHHFINNCFKEFFCIIFLFIVCNAHTITLFTLFFVTCCQLWLDPDIDSAVWAFTTCDWHDALVVHDGDRPT